MPRRKQYSKSEALEAINSVWVGQTMTHVALESALEAAGKDGALEQIQSLKETRQLVGRVVFDPETNTISHVYGRGA